MTKRLVKTIIESLIAKSEAEGDAAPVPEDIKNILSTEKGRVKKSVLGNLLDYLHTTQSDQCDVLLNHLKESSQPGAKSTVKDFLERVENAGYETPEDEIEEDVTSTEAEGGPTKDRLLFKRLDKRLANIEKIIQQLPASVVDEGANTAYVELLKKFDDLKPLSPPVPKEVDEKLDHLSNVVNMIQKQELVKPKVEPPTIHGIVIRKPFQYTAIRKRR